MWNHRSLDDPIQESIESIIRHHIVEYDYGSRREDQTEYLRKSGLFSRTEQFDAVVTHTLLNEDVIEAWRSHATLHRQAGAKFASIIQEITDLLYGSGTDTVQIWTILGHFPP